MGYISMKTFVVFWEILLLLASVLVFRSIWLFLDDLIGVNQRGLWVSLVLGVTAASISLYVLNKYTKE